MTKLHESRAARPWMTLLFALLLLLCGLWHLHVLNRWMAGRSDLTSPWVGARVAFEGGDAYALPATQEIQHLFFGHVLPAGIPDQVQQQAFVYPLYSTFLMAPLTWMPLTAARVVFTIVAVLALAFVTLLWLRLLGITLSRWGTVAWIALALVNWPVLVALRHQQMTLAAFVFLSLAVYAQASDRSFAAGALLALATIKPQFVVVAILWSLARSIYQQQRWRVCAGFATGMTTLLLAAEMLHHHWIHGWIEALMAYHFYTHSRPSLEFFFGTGWGVLLLAGVAVLPLFALARCFRQRPSISQFGVELSLILSLTVAICPTNFHWIYNQVLLLPGCLYLAAFRAQARSAAALRTIALGCTAFSLLSVPVAVLGESVLRPGPGWDFLPYLNLFLPCTVALGLAAALFELRQRPLTPGRKALR